MRQKTNDVERSFARSYGGCEVCKFVGIDRHGNEEKRKPLKLIFECDRGGE